MTTLAQDPTEDEQESSQESKPSWTAPNSPQPSMSQGEVTGSDPVAQTGSDPVAQALAMGKPQQSNPSPHQVLRQRKRPFKVNPHFFPVNDWGLRLQINSTQIQPELFFFGHESGKNVNLLRSWLVSFCDNCLSSLKPPTRCTSSLTEME